MWVQKRAILLTTVGAVAVFCLLFVQRCIEKLKQNFIQVSLSRECFSLKWNYV